MTCFNQLENERSIEVVLRRAVNISFIGCDQPVIDFARFVQFALMQQILCSLRKPQRCPWAPPRLTVIPAAYAATCYMRLLYGRRPPT